jgi:uncharacterized membrane protein YbaN (DUF454 family)
MIRKAKKYIFLFLGFLFTVIGIIGAFLPVLPTTPFLLAAAFFFSKSSEKFHNWILNHKIFGPAIKDYYNERKITLQTRKKALTMLWISIIISCIILFPKIIHIIFLLIIASLVTYKILKIPLKNN